jgi:hypothetical protein
MAVACRRARPAAEVLLALAVWTMQGAAEAEQAGCSMLPVPGFVAVGVGRKLTASCRLRPMLANSFESCSAGCLSQEYCDAVTWFSHEHHVPALRGKCVRRTAGTDLILRNQSHSTSAFRRCSYQSCGLQRQMDAWCAAAQAVPTNVPSSTECMARNVRVLKSSAEDFTFQCVPVPSLHAPLAMACVDDRGHSLPCRTDTSNAKSCAQSSQGELHDMHRRGCGGLPTCLATPGMGPPSPPLATMHHHLHSVREAAAGQKVQHGDRRLPTWRSKLVGGTHNTVSWWLGTGDAGGDPFDADAFLELLSRFSANPEEPPSVQRRPATVFFVGDSTARQQAVSLCCLLHAGLGATGSPFSVEVTVNNPFMTFACQVARRAPGVQPILAKIRYGRSNRGGSLSSWRPLELTPVLDHELAHAIAQTPDVLILNLGAWTFEDGCRDMHSLHDELCNGTRPWVLHEYAQLWTLLAGALNGAYTPQKRRHSLVLLRTASPRDFEGGKAGVGTCRRTAPIPKGELEEQEERVDLSGMRASVLTKNLILDAVAAQRMPWVRVLDAYEISRARADAHPSRYAAHLAVWPHDAPCASKMYHEPMRTLFPPSLVYHLSRFALMRSPSSSLNLTMAPLQALPPRFPSPTPTGAESSFTPPHFLLFHSRYTAGHSSNPPLLPTRAGLRLPSLPPLYHPTYHELCPRLLPAA